MLVPSQEWNSSWPLTPPGFRQEIQVHLDAAAHGNERAIEALYPLVTAEYRRYAQGCGFDPDEVEDVASDAFVTLWADLQSQTARVRDQDWDLIAYVRRAANLRRKNREYTINPETVPGSAVLPVDDWEEEEVESERLDAEAAEDEQRRAVLRRAIESLRPYPRFYLTLRFLEGQHPREIAGRTGEQPARVARRVRSFSTTLTNRLKGRRPGGRRPGRKGGTPRGVGEVSPTAMPSPSAIRRLVREFCHDNPDSSAGDFLQFILETTGCHLDRPTFYTDYWVPRRTAVARGSEQLGEVDPPPRAPDDFRLKDGQLRRATQLSQGMRAHIRAFVLVLREDDPGISAREAMRKAGERHGVAFKDIHSFRALYFSTRAYGQRIGKGSGGLRVLKGRTPAEIEAFVGEVLQRRPEASAEDVRRATNLALGTEIKAIDSFRARYVAPARRRLGIPNPPPPALGAWVPPCPPEGWRVPGTLSLEERESVVCWLREQLMADCDASGVDLFARARVRFEVDWRGSKQFNRAYLWRARGEPGAGSARSQRLAAEDRKDVTEFIRVQLAADASLSPSRTMSLVNQEFGTGFRSLGSFRSRYFNVVRDELRTRASSAGVVQSQEEPRMSTTVTPAGATLPAASPFALRTSDYTPQEKARAIEWLVPYITENPTCRVSEARAAVESALDIRVAEGTFFGGFFKKALDRCAPEIRAVRGQGSSPLQPPAVEQAKPTDRQRERVRQLVACLKRDRPELMSDLPALMAQARGLDGVPYNDAGAFRRHYVDPVQPAAPGDPYPVPKSAAHIRPVPTRREPKAPPASPDVEMRASAEIPRDLHEGKQTQRTTAIKAKPVAQPSPLPADVLTLLAADPVRAIRLEGVEGAPGHARIVLDSGSLPMVDATRLYAALFAAVAEVLA
jgi:RNA polymerase sigma factor (sigma-70 family)